MVADKTPLSLELNSVVFTCVQLLEEEEKNNEFTVSAITIGLKKSWYGETRKLKITFIFKF